MALRTVTIEDIANAIRSADLGSAGMSALLAADLNDLDHLRIYRRGYTDALATIAVAFGIAPTTYAMNSTPMVVESYCVSTLEE